jgi:menaquinol-cytochrome c reductase iron-sulfur subunit
VKPAHQAADIPRRGALTILATLVTGALATLPPVGAALALVFDPLRRRGGAVAGDGFTRVAPLEALPADGVPRVFPVIDTPLDAWNRYAEQPVGSVYLRRTADEPDVLALSSTCPHAGCFVDFDRGRDVFACPCHLSTFEPDGARIDPQQCPSPRNLDALEVAVRDGEIWVKYQRFRPATPEKIVEA